MDEKQRRGLRAAVESGFDFLEGALESHGGWPEWRYDNTALVGERYIETPHPPVTNGYAVLALTACRHPRAPALIARTRDYLRSWMQYPGLWNYRRGFPPDVEDTAIGSLGVGPHPWARMGRLWGANISVMLSNRDGDGRFFTWMLKEGGPHNNVDAVVNANVLAYMGDHPETRDTERWIETVVADRREVEASPYYIEAVDLHFAMARATTVRECLFSRARPGLAARLLERLQAEEKLDDAMRTAQALSALDMLGCELDEATRSAGLAALLDTQLPDGSWPACLICREPTGWAAWAAAIGRPQHVAESWGFASEVLTTVFCVEALQRTLG